MARYPGHPGRIIRREQAGSVGPVSLTATTAALPALAHLAAVEETAAIGGKRVDRVRSLAVERMLEGLRQGRARVEEEPFRRGAVAATWRHLSLHLAVCAVGTADERTVFDPGVRRGLVESLELQETEELSAVRGGFRTSTEGFVTSYATVQGLEAMTAV